MSSCQTGKGLAPAIWVTHPYTIVGGWTDASGQELSAPLPISARVAASGVGLTQTARPILLPTFSDQSGNSCASWSSLEADAEVEFGIQDSCRGSTLDRAGEGAVSWQGQPTRPRSAFWTFIRLITGVREGVALCDVTLFRQGGPQRG